MIKLIAVIVVIIILMYVSLNVTINFIKNNDDVNICNKKIVKLALSIFSGIAIGILYLKYYTLPVKFLRYAVLMFYLIISRYIDYHTTNVYDFLSYIFFALGLIFLAIDFFYYGEIRLYIIGAVGTLIVSSIISAFKFLGWGDVEVFSIASLYVGGFVSLLNIFLAIAIAGIDTVYKLLRKQVKLSDRGTLCPFIAVSTYIILFFVI